MLDLVTFTVSVVIETVDARQFAVAEPCIEALAIVKEKLNVPVHFVHVRRLCFRWSVPNLLHFSQTSGAKMFSSHVGMDQSGFLNDDGDVYETMSALNTTHPVMKQVFIFVPHLLCSRF
jgi:hypothetical protein